MPLQLLNISSFEEFLQSDVHNKAAKIREQENKVLVENSGETFVIEGECFVCNVQTEFLVDYLYSAEAVNGEMRIPNWRERQICPNCGLNSRMRAAIHILEKLRPDINNETTYITEAVTPLFRVLSNRYSSVIGSEFFGNTIDLGSEVDGVRNEDITQLTFDPNSLDSILSFDVLEHVPNYTAALQECFRCLKENGTLLLTFPFVINESETLTRATIDEVGNVKHILPPEYHGDPINLSDGVLCFYHFGWDVLLTLKKAGFRNSKVILYWSPEYGYLGGFNPVITAIK